MTNKLNNTNFKLMVCLSLLFVLINVSFLILCLMVNHGYIRDEEGRSIDSMSFLIIFILSIMFFKRDRDFLRNNKAYCPAWGWYFLFPVYIYLRQKKNALSLNYFWIYMVITFILAKIASQLSITIITKLLSW